MLSFFYPSVIFRNTETAIYSSQIIYTNHIFCTSLHDSGACPGIRRGGGAKSESVFFVVFFCFSIFQGGPAAHKIAEKIIFSTEKVAKYS